MDNTQPSKQDIEELISYLPRLYEEGFKPIKQWQGGDKREDGSISFPWPEYNKIVSEFFEEASKDCWNDSGYNPEEACKLIQDDEYIKNATLHQIKTLLTYCVRGERFCTGHWEAVIREGYIKRILERLIDSRGE